jgi:hypothetical protein
MEFLFVPKSISPDQMENEVVKANDERIKFHQEQVEQMGGEKSFSTANLGKGADWTWLHFIITFGEQLGKVLGAIGSYNSLKDLVTPIGSIKEKLNKVREESSSIIIDEEGAWIYAISQIFEEFGQFESIELLAKSTTPLNDLSGAFLNRNKGEFLSHPFAVYSFSFKVNDSVVVCLRVESDGEVIEEYRKDISHFYL